MLVSFAGGQQRWPGLAIMLPLVAAAGCGAGMHTVEGKVLYQDGAPCTGGMILFEPLDPEIVKSSSRGFIEDDGSFTMSTDESNDGVLEGRYRVIVVPVIGDPQYAGSPINGKYWRPETSPLEYTVIAGKNQPTFKMDPADPKQPKIIE